MRSFKWLLALGIVVLVAGLAFSAWANRQARERIAQLEADQKELEATKLQLETTNAEILARERALEEQVRAKQTDVDANLAEVQRLSAELDAVRVQQFTTSRPAEYRQKIANFFPEMAGSDWGVYQAKDENGLNANYLRVPLGMADAFMFNQSARVNLEEQNEQLTDAVDLQREIIGLKDEVVALERQRADAWQQGFDTAFMAYSEINQELRDELRQPKFNVDMPKRGVLVGTTLLGILLGGL
jgi:hypothetical protein